MSAYRMTRNISMMGNLRSGEPLAQSLQSSTSVRTSDSCEQDQGWFGNRDLGTVLPGGKKKNPKKQRNKTNEVVKGTSVSKIF